MPLRTVTTNDQEQTLTNKTLTSPVITGPTITGGTVTGATVSGGTISGATFTATGAILTTPTITDPTITGAVLDKVESVTFHGATGDGTTDDTAAIQAAIDTAEAAGTAIFFPPGTYQLTTSLVVDSAITIQTSGRRTIIRQESWGVPAFEIRASDVSIIGGLHLRCEASRTLFDSAALTASNNNATVKTEASGDTKIAGSALYCVNYSRLYVDQLTVFGFIAAFLMGGNPASEDVVIGSLTVDTVDFGLLGTRVKRMRVGSVMGKDIKETQGEPSHIVYFTGTDATASEGVSIGGIACHGTEVTTSHAISIKGVRGFYLGSLFGSAVGSLAVFHETVGEVGSIFARDMVELSVGVSTLGTQISAQTSSRVAIGWFDIDSNAQAQSTTQRVALFSCSAGCELHVLGGRAYMSRNPEPAVVFRNTGLGFARNLNIVYDAAPVSGVGAFMPAGTRSATVNLFIDRPRLTGTDQLLRSESGSEAFSLDYDPNLIASGAPVSSTIVSATGTYHTRYVAPMETAATIGPFTGSASFNVRHANMFVTANTAAATITGFTTSTDGQIVTVIAGDANTSLEHGTNMKLKGGATRALGADEAVSFVMRSGIAYEL